MIEQMRADFADAASWEGWSVAEQAELGTVIRTAMARNDAEALAYWAWRIDVAAEEWRRWRARVRQAEARIKAARTGEAR